MQPERLEQTVADGRFAMLMVCTGNIGRSPMMERLMRSELARSDADSNVSVVSAGTLAQPGRRMEPGAAMALAELGADVEDFGAAALTPEVVERSDLVLVATRDHRSDVVSMVPSAVRRTFTMGEFARIVLLAPPIPVSTGDLPASNPLALPDSMRAAVAWAAQMRGSVPKADPEDADDLPDPLGAPDEVYRARAAAIAASVERIVPYLLGAGSAG
jgi:protein-tyrosine phosphatase